MVAVGGRRGGGRTKSRDVSRVLKRHSGLAGQADPLHGRKGVRVCLRQWLKERRQFLRECVFAFLGAGRLRGWSERRRRVVRPGLRLRLGVGGHGKVGSRRKEAAERRFSVGESAHRCHWKPSSGARATGIDRNA